jgi:hypothetical protein
MDTDVEWQRKSIGIGCQVHGQYMGQSGRRERWECAHNKGELKARDNERCMGPGGLHLYTPTLLQHSIGCHRQQEPRLAGDPSSSLGLLNLSGHKLLNQSWSHDHSTNEK